MRPVDRVRLTLVTLVAAGALSPAPVTAQARFYWKTLTGANAVPLIVMSASGNTNPFDPGNVVTPGAQVEATMATFGYGRTFALFGRGAMLTALFPMGRISGEVTTAGTSFDEAARGFGDPMLEFVANVVGPRAQRNLVDVLRYEPRFSVDFLADLAVPIGEYDSDRPLNLGQNRWYGRIGAPVVWQLGAWVPGRRTTLEAIPAVWLFGDNTDFVGQTLATEPLFQLDAHVTRDLSERLWASLDGVWYTGGTATVDGVKGEALNNLAVGVTLGYQVNKNMILTAGYKSTVDDRAPGDLQMDGLTVALIYGWHALVEGAGRLEGEH
jgi:hypothetical protein